LNGRSAVELQLNRSCNHRLISTTRTVTAKVCTEKWRLDNCTHFIPRAIVKLATGSALWPATAVANYLSVVIKTKVFAAKIVTQSKCSPQTRNYR